MNIWLPKNWIVEKKTGNDFVEILTVIDEDEFVNTKYGQRHDYRVSSILISRHSMYSLILMLPCLLGRL